MSASVRWWRELGIALIYVSGLLYHTAIFNLASSGVPLYFIGVGAMVFALAVRGRGPSLSDVSVLFFCVGALLLASLAHILMSKYSASEFTQLGARIFFLLSFFTCINFVRVFDPDGRVFIRSVKWLTVAYVLCGFYEFYAKRVGLAIPFDWIANNKSYSVASGLNGGWLGESAIRVRTFWAEPSSSVIPVLLSLFFIVKGWLFRSIVWNWIWFFLVLLYVIITGSRNIYLCALSMLVVLGVVRVIGRVNGGLVKPFFIFSSVLSVFMAFTWQLIVLTLFDDLSATGRASSVAVGLGIWVQNIFFGTGYNTFDIESYRYSMAGALYTSETIIQNSILANLQQAGLVGAIAIFAPLYMAINKTSARWRDLSPFWIALLILAAVSAGLEYSSAFWLLVSVFYAASFGNDLVSDSRTRMNGAS